jgi:uncharacterized membrane protein YhaH (DUF805 family)
VSVATNLPTRLVTSAREREAVAVGALPPASWRPSPVVLTAVTLTSLVAAVTFSGAITTRALLVGLGPSLLLAVVATAAVTRATSIRIGAATGVVVALAAAEVVNVLAGNDNGPAARSTFAAAGLAALAVALVYTRRPAAFLGPVAGIVAAAAGLGSGAEVQGVAAVTAVTALLTLALVEGQARRWHGRRRRGWASLVLLVAISALAAGGAWLVLDDHRGPKPAVFSVTSVDSQIRPPVVGVGPTQLRHHRHHKRHHQQAAAPQAPDTTEDRVTHPKNSTPITHALLSTLSRLLLLLIVAAVLAVVLRRLWVLIAWQRLRSRLHRGDPAAVVAGAWVWTQRRLVSYGAGLPPSLSADRIAAVGVPSAAPRRVARPLGTLAGQVTVSTFSGAATSPEAAAGAWRFAGESVAGARHGLSPLGRVRSWFRSPHGQTIA